MKNPKLDVSPWNLGLPLVLLAACGRTLPLPELEGETDATATEDPTEPSDPTIDPTSGECENYSDCPPGYYCSDDKECVGYYSNDDDYCGTSCCWDGCCYGGCYYYDCYSDEECGENYVCIDYSCQPSPEQWPPVCAEIPVGFEAPAGVHDYKGEISLAFVDTPADGHELVIADSQRVRVLAFEGSTDVAEIQSLSMDVADIDGDGDEDIVVLSPTGLHAFPFDAATGFVVGPVTAIDPLESGRLSLADFDGNGSADAFVSAQDWTARFAGVGDGMFAAPSVVASATCNLIAVPSAADTVTQDVMYGEGSQGWYVFGGPMVDFAPYNLGGSVGATQTCPIAAGDFDADGFADAVMLDALETGIVTRWRSIATLPDSDTWSPPLVHEVAGIGDLDADGYDDLVLAGATTDATLRFGTGKGKNNDPLGCYGVVSLGFAPRILAIGDLDANGRDDIVGADGSTVWVSLAVD